MAELFIVLVLIIILIMVGVVIADSNRFVIRTVNITSSKVSRDHSFLFISDLHCKQYGRNNERLINAIKKVNAEACLIAGDMVTAVPGKSVDVPVKLVSEIHKYMPVYYSYGNHEYRLKIYENKYGNMFQQLVKGLAKSDIKLLDNEKVILDDICVQGLTIEKEYYKRFTNQKLPTEKMKQYLGELDSDRFNLILAHNPDYFETYKEYGADLILSGHIHGGVARIPGIGGVISPNGKLFPKYSGGVYKEDNSTLVVNCGLGAHTIPLRFLNPAEIIVINIKKD